MVGMVILNYNDSETVIKLYETIKSYKTIDYVVIVDNCSTDDSFVRLKESCKCDVIMTKKNGGYAYGNNRGICWLRDNYSCKYFIVSNPDVIFEEQFVKKIVKKMKDNSSIGIMSGVMHDRNGDIVKSPYGTTTSYKKALLECFYLYRYYQMNYAVNKLQLEKELNYVQVIWGSLFVISDEAYKAIGGFDEGTFLYHEENIISERMKRAGYKEAILTTVSFNHIHAVSISKGTDRMMRHKMGAKSQYYFQNKYHNLTSREKKLLQLLLKYSITELNAVNHFLSFFGK